MTNKATPQQMFSSASWNRVPCALVLEDNPLGEGEDIGENRLDFESMPESIEESYSVAPYREIAADRMPQPGFVAYRGGNWNTFSLELKFRAAQQPLSNERFRDLSLVSSTDLEEILLSMERKVRWCEALLFPLEREATTFVDRVRQRVETGGLPESALRFVDESNFKRRDPPILLVVFGSFLVIRCYAENINIRWEAPFHPTTARPYGATVTLALKRIDLEYPTFESIRNSAGNLPESLSSQNIPRVRGDVTLRDAQRRQREFNLSRAQSAARAAAQGAAGIALSV